MKYKLKPGESLDLAFNWNGLHPFKWGKLTNGEAVELTKTEHESIKEKCVPVAAEPRGENHGN